MTNRIARQGRRSSQLSRLLKWPRLKKRSRPTLMPILMLKMNSKINKNKKVPLRAKNNNLIKHKLFKNHLNKKIN